MRAVQPHLGPVGVFCAFPGFAISLWDGSFRNAEWRQDGFVRVVDQWLVVAGVAARVFPFACPVRSEVTKGWPWCFLDAADR